MERLLCIKTCDADNGPPLVIKDHIYTAIDAKTRDELQLLFPRKDHDRMSKGLYYLILENQRWCNERLFVNLGDLPAIEEDEPETINNPQYEEAQQEETQEAIGLSTGQSSPSCQVLG